MQRGQPAAGTVEGRWEGASVGEGGRNTQKGIEDWGMSRFWCRGAAGTAENAGLMGVLFRGAAGPGGRTPPVTRPGGAAGSQC